MVECAVCCRPFENSLAAVVGFMADRGYRAFDITDHNYSPKHGVLWLVEIVFVRESSPVWQKLDSYQ